MILTGIRANNDLHIGNYFGALLPIVDMAKTHSSEYQINLFVPDLHSITTPIDHKTLQKQVLNNLKIFVAAGLPLDNPDIHIYRQSHIPAHSELTVILNNFTSFGALSRMTQYKDKSSISDGEKRRILQHISRVVDEANKEGVALPDTPTRTINKYFRDATREFEKALTEQTTVGLLDYPVLMAADILLYGAKYVPVGEDQTQHLEFTRDIAKSMNVAFHEVCPEGLFEIIPEPINKQHEFFGKDQDLRVRDLVDPTKKMSKSSESGRGIIFLGDEPEDAAQKIMSATTDSLNNLKDVDVDNQPGIANLIKIQSLISPSSSTVTPQERTQYGVLKAAVAEDVSKFLKDFQVKLAQVDESAILQKLEADEAKMTEVANATLLKVQKAVGLRP